MGIFKRGNEILPAGRLYVISFFEGIKEKAIFDELESYCMFIGYPRSGHSLIGSLLDAHRHVIIAHELDVLKYIYARFKWLQLLHLLRLNSWRYAQGGRVTGRFVYTVPGQWQGKSEHLKVIGDKKGAGSTLRLQANPELLQRLRRTFSLQMKFIHVIRNPFDNISTLSIRDQRSLSESADYYFSLCDTIEKIKTQISESEWFEIRHETFIGDSKKLIRQLCYFLGVDAPENYLQDCASIVRVTPHQSRYKVRWDRDLIHLVEARMSQYDFLAGYSYNN